MSEPEKFSIEEAKCICGLVRKVCGVAELYVCPTCDSITIEERQGKKRIKTAWDAQFDLGMNKKMQEWYGSYGP